MSKAEKKVSKKTSIDLDEDTLRLLAELQKGFGVSTNARVVKLGTVMLTLTHWFLACEPYAKVTKK